MDKAITRKNFINSLLSLIYDAFIAIIIRLIILFDPVAIRSEAKL